MEQYLDLVDAVLSDGAYKPNRTGVDTISRFSHHYEIDLGAGYPLLTTKRMDGFRWNSMLHEVAWYLSGDEHIRDLREETKIWDAWADAEGRLDTAYGRFWRRFPVPEPSARLDGESWPDADHRWVTAEADGRHTFDQLQYVTDTLAEDPTSRRMVVNAWHPANAADSTLPPCHYTYVLSVQGDSLNCHLTQRSGDVALGIPFNIAAYSLLTTIIAQQTDYTPGVFGHSIVDAHVYCGTDDRGAWYADHLDELQSRMAAVTDRAEYAEVAAWIEMEAPEEPATDEGFDHVPGLLTQLTRKPLPRPTLEVEPVTIDEFAPEHVTLNGYESHDGLYFAVAE